MEPGFDRKNGADMLQPFQSGNSSLDQSKVRRGSGLGLAIAQDVARAHHGEIRFERRTGVGFVAALVLPGPSSSNARPPS